jgi:hypothetical protein
MKSRHRRGGRPGQLASRIQASADPAVNQRLARARRRSVMICTPIARNPAWEYTASLAATLLFLNEQGIGVSFHFVVGSAIVHRARNELVAHFLASSFTDLLFIDDDMQFSPLSVMRLLGSDKPLIGGVGRQRNSKPNTDPSVWCWRPLRDAAGAPIRDEMGAVEVRGFGAAFMLISRQVFLRLAEAHPEWKRAGNADWPPEVRAGYFEFFTQTEGDEFGELSEDYGFCHRWRQLGERVWADPTIRLGHVGAFNYTGSVDETLIPTLA